MVTLVAVGLNAAAAVRNLFFHLLHGVVLQFHRPTVTAAVPVCVPHCMAMLRVMLAELLRVDVNVGLKQKQSINKLRVKLLYYRIWIRDVFWLGVLGPLGPGTKIHLESRCCAILIYNLCFTGHVATVAASVVAVVTVVTVVAFRVNDCRVGVGVRRVLCRIIVSVRVRRAYVHVGGGGVVVVVVGGAVVGVRVGVGVAGPVVTSDWHSIVLVVREVAVA